MLKLHFETLTPLHISNGNELAYGLEYTLRNNVFRKFNFARISSILASGNAFDFSKNISVRDIEKIIDDNFNKYSQDDFFYKIKIHPKFYELTRNSRATGQKFVQEFINSNGKFYVPGSTIKGALLSVLKYDHLGINNDDSGKIEQKFVIRDSENIEQDNFIVYTTENRPPSVNLMCMKAGIKFDVDILKMGILKKDYLIEKLRTYSKKQINLAVSNLQPYKGRDGREKGADIFEKGLESILGYNLNENEYLINLGFGGGSWFKAYENIVPKFPSKSRARRNQPEPAHTSFSVFLKNQTIHIGWCKIKID